MAILDVNHKDIIAFTAKLEKLNRSAFPSAVRNTLNDAAFETKKLVPKVAGQKFTIRQKNLFKVFTGVEKARGFDLRKMQSATGIRNVSGRDRLAKGLATQETGGTVKGRKLVPHKLGRIGNSQARKLRRKHHFNNVEIARPGRRKKGAKYLLLKKGGGNGAIFNIENGKFTPVYTYTNSRNKRLRKRPFLRPASLVATKRMNRFYIDNAKFQFNKALKK